MPYAQARRVSLIVCSVLASTRCSEFVDRVPDAGPVATEECTATCFTVGLLDCAAEGQRRVCVESASGCLDWQPAAACPNGTTCRDAGSCGADGCGSDGLRVCRGDAGFETCERKPGGFLGWSGFQACTAGTSCVDAGECAATEPECASVGLKRCEGGLVQTCAVIDAVLAFGPASACPDGESCRGDGVCGLDLCGLGESRCGEAGLETCVADAVGFLDYDGGTPCPGEGGVCRNDRCGMDSCSAPGQRVCTTEGLLDECQLAAEGFLAWSGGVGCPDGGVCRDGLCGADLCPTVGTSECIGADIRVCDFSGPFLEWGESASCQGGACFGGACITSECAGLGASKCADDAFVSLCQKQTTGAFAWGPPIPCPGVGTVCRAAGVCGKDSCAAEGGIGCLGEAATRRCGYYGAPFLTWGPGDDCAIGLECRGGVCSADECDGGAPVCTLDGQIERCELSNDGFFAIVGPEPCPAPEMVCVTGSEGAACEFEGPFTVAMDVDHYAVAAGQDGGAVVVWGTAGTLELVYLRGDGLPESPVTTVGNGAGGTGAGGSGAGGNGVPGTRASVAVPATGPLAGQAVVVWYDATDEALRVRVVPKAGVAPAAFALPVKYELTAETSLASVGDPSGGLALRHEVNGANGARLFASQVDATGVAYSVEFGQTAGGTFRGLAAASDGPSGFVSVWASGAETSSTLALRRVDLTGGTIDPVRQADFSEALSALSICSHGATWLVASERAFGSAVLGVGLAVFGAGVQPISPVWQTELAGLLSPRLVCLPDGALLLGLIPDTKALVGRRVLSTGTLAGGTVAFTGAGDDSMPDGARLADGRVLVLAVQDDLLRARFWEP